MCGSYERMSCGMFDMQQTDDDTDRGNGREGDEIVVELEKKQAELASIVSL